MYVLSLRDYGMLGRGVVEVSLGVAGVIVGVGVGHCWFAVGVDGFPRHGLEGGDWLWRGWRLVC